MAQKDSVTLFIENLDSGYVVNEGNKRTAVESIDTIRKNLDFILKSMTHSLSDTSTVNTSITITVETNLPICS